MTIKVVMKPRMTAKVVMKPRTLVKKVVVGTPIRKVSAPAVPGLGGALDLSNLENGSLLIYNSSNSTWTAKKDIEEEQNIDGGAY